MNRNFNASISVLGIKEPKVQQAILKLLENSLFQKELLGKTSDNLTENIRRLRQQMSNTESHAFAIIDTNLGEGNTAIPMAGIVLDDGKSYSVRVTFRNKDATERLCVVNGTTVSLAGGVGQLASHQFVLAGSGTLTIDNIATSVDVFITIWR